MSLDSPVILTCSISGSLADRAQCPAIPYTPAEYAAEARRIVDEGCVHVHIHARSPDGAPSYEIEDFAAIQRAIRDEVGDALIVNFSTGTIGVSVEKRIAYLEACRPEVAALNMGSMNYAKYSARRKQFVFSTVFPNPFDEIVALLEAMRRLDIKPEHECFDVGHVGNLAPLIDMGLLDGPLHADFVMGVTGGILPTARNLATMADNLYDVGRALPIVGLPGTSDGDGSDTGRSDAGGSDTAAPSETKQRSALDPAPRDHHWGVIGISRVQWPMLAAALGLGGSIRVGLEDNFYLPDGAMARSNGELIAVGRRMAFDAGRRLATVDEARAMLGVRAR